MPGAPIPLPSHHGNLIPTALLGIIICDLSGLDLHFRGVWKTGALAQLIQYIPVLESMTTTLKVGEAGLQYGGNVFGTAPVGFCPSYNAHSPHIFVSIL